MSGLCKIRSLSTNSRKSLERAQTNEAFKRRLNNRAVAFQHGCHEWNVHLGNVYIICGQNVVGNSKYGFFFKCYKGNKSCTNHF